MALQKSEKLLTLLSEVKKEINEITLDELKQKQAKGEACYVIDVREDSEWERGHMPDAIHIGRGVLEFKIEEKFPDLDDCLILVCGGGNRSALAVKQLKTMGYRNAWSLIGGFRGWTSDGGDVII